ncbi:MULTISPECIES: hypothetical protein [unclassified Acidovorax]|uniref:hypothetical protein n=1 Tax=unclassified Acidovorax TaxID=2684926 RepID=UPI001C465628|nr:MULTISPECIES: hypothetical protein [unclassified Acidovorax]MBV7460935.1 hypothetical protein [Acidovorax sp. sif0632]MBV7465961.1 hypothetical protein [Acidovorax sp. sif0613]
MTEQIPKGPAAEEALRNYFLNIGYFVARGCKFTYNRFDVTDVDLWLYARNSPLSRERVNVDIKNKKTPQALERIFWAKGLQTVLGLDSCVVATTDSRPDVRDFGLQHDVKVLDGKFLARLTKSAKSQQDRISEEEFLQELDDGALGRLTGDWRGRYELSKARLLHSLNFDGCNAWLENISLLLSDIGAGIPRWRLLYVTCAHLLIAIDFILRDHVTSDHDQRKAILDAGIRFGESGQAFTEKVSRIAASLVESVAAQPGLALTVQQEIEDQASQVKAEILAEFFAKNTSGFFDIALQLEGAAFSPALPMPSALPASCQSVIGVLADFCGVDRKLAIQ